MILSDLLGETYSALSGNKVRSGLTMLGIVIGISSVIALVAVGQGATASITANISSLGSNLLIVSPGASTGGGPVSGGLGSATTLSQADATAITKGAPDVKMVAVELSKRYQITFKSSNTNAAVIGTDQNYLEVRNVAVDQGAFFNADQSKQYERVAVIGPTVASTLFTNGASPIGQKIKINQVQFTVIGTTATKGGSALTSSDSEVFIPVTTAQRYLAGKASISTIDIEATSADTISSAQQEVTDVLLTQHRISDPTQADFTVLNQADVVSSLSSVTSTLTLLLGAISGISLLVGGIGIMNMMLTTVTERTREIGLRKAIGAKSRDISTQFLVEAIMLTFVGGLLGILLGWGIATFVSANNIVQATVTTQSVLLAFGVSALVGIVFGFYPASRAARLRPIDALKYE